MYKKLAIIFIISTLVFATETRQKVVILDTGIESDFPSKFLCSEGSKDFSEQGLEDTNKHGTNLAYIISKSLDTKKECLAIVKFYSEKERFHFSHLADALSYVTTLGISYINMSFGGGFPSPREKGLIEKLLQQDVIIAVAAGNNGTNLNFWCNYYPACYANYFNNANYHVVASCKDGKYAPYSNFGDVVTDCKNGTKVTGGDYTFSGTSQATAIQLGELIKLNRKTRDFHDR